MGEIHRLSFGRGDTAAGRESEGGYGPNDPNDPNAGEYGGYGRGYDRGYDQGEYPGQEQDGYEQGVGYADESAPAGRYDVLYRSDWLTWLLLVVLPPLGIWILWRRERLEPKPRLIVSGVAAAWFIVLLIWIFSAIFGHGADQTMGVGTITPPESIVVGATATPAPTGVLTGDLPSGTLDITTTPAPAAQATPRPGGSSGSSDSNNSFDETADTSGAEDADTTYIWSSTSDSYYHKTDTCTNITGTPVEDFDGHRPLPRADGLPRVLRRAEHRRHLLHEQRRQVLPQGQDLLGHEERTGGHQGAGGQGGQEALPGLHRLLLRHQDRQVLPHQEQLYGHEERAIGHQGGGGQGGQAALPGLRQEDLVQEEAPPPRPRPTTAPPRASTTTSAPPARA